ncbi:hypothetical protein ANRL3_00578 [Anaerolineae bacterium]|nr:hypothetical protein ANRL3_00578 [Anaerolineae bacterium]
MPNLNFMNFCRFMFLALAIFPTHETLAEDLECPTPRVGGAHQGYGPFDYITQKDKLPVVEGAHFTPKVAALISGERSYLAGDLDYTLRAFPNHHRALESLIELALRSKTTSIPNMTFSVPCFLIRASKFVPTDGLVNALYANYLSRIGQKELAKSEAELAIKKTPNNPRVAYNIGLAYFYLGDYKSAKEYSDMAKKLGSSAVGLDKLLSGSVPQSHR